MSFWKSGYSGDGMTLRVASLLVVAACVFPMQLLGFSSSGVTSQEPGEADALTSNRQQDVDSPGSGTVWDGVFTEGQASRGERRFQQVCGQCHRDNEFSGSLFRRSWTNQSVGDLFELMTTTMPEGNPGSLRPEEYSSIVAFILRANGYPAGEEELPTDLFELSNVHFVEAPE
jgi:mono/diheme cytochrome c family protein